MAGRKRGARPKGPNTIRFELNPAQASFVATLIRNGTFGENPTEVVKSLVNLQLQQLQKEGTIPKEAVFAELHSLPSQTAAVQTDSIDNTSSNSIA